MQPSDTTSPVVAEVLAVGDELTSGQCVDTNSAWLSRRLTALGLRVAWHTTAGDQLPELEQALRTAASRAQVVVLTGGLGPTEDDLTRQALAQAAGVELEFRPELWEHIRELFRRRGRSVPEQNRQQALLPRGAGPLHNPQGTAPGIAMPLPGQEGPAAWVFALPGVPAEMHQMWPQVEQELRRQGLAQGVVVERAVRVFGPGESDLQQRLPGLFARGGNPQVGITVSGAVMTLRITARGTSQQECQRRIEPVWQQIHQALGEQIFGYDQDELQHAVARLLHRQQLRLATLEWGTQGRLACWMSQVPQAQQVFHGGQVFSCWPPEATWFAGAREPLPQGATDEKVLAWAARAARDQLGREVLVLATGPFPPEDAPDDPRRQVRFALAWRGGVELWRRRYTGHPQVRRVRAARQALDALRRWLLGGGASRT